MRVLETIVVPDARHGKVLLLRDLQGVAKGYAKIPPPLIPIVARFDGRHTCEEIAEEASAEIGEEVSSELVADLAEELDRGLFLEGPAFRAAHAEVVRAFAEAPVRPTAHAGGAYTDDPIELARYLDSSCLEPARSENEPKRARAATKTAKSEGRRAKGQRATGLVAPHIDPWRGAIGYGRSYGALAESLAEDADTFVIFGTSHAPMRQPFALCRKAFATPFGDVPADLEAIDRLAKSARFDPYEDLFNHRREHAIEFQVVLLKHLLGARPAKIIPILAGLGTHQARGTDPASDPAVESFLDGVRELVAERPGRVVVVAGADMAHVGPRFGDKGAYDERARTKLEATDRASLEAACAGDASEFWRHVARDLDTRRVCGLAPIYALLRTVAAPSGSGSLVHYEQTIDDDDGSIVSHAGITYAARET